MSLISNAHIVLFMLGTNDAKACNWSQDRFIEDYTRMVQTYLDSKSKPDVFVMIPPPLYIDGIFDEMNQKVINELLPQLIPSIVQKIGNDKVHIINLNEGMGGSNMDQQDLFSDGCHPNDQGYERIAGIIYQ